MTTISIITEYITIIQIVQSQYIYLNLYKNYLKLYSVFVYNYIDTFKN